MSWYNSYVISCIWQDSSIWAGFRLWRYALHTRFQKVGQVLSLSHRFFCWQMWTRRVPFWLSPWMPIRLPPRWCWWRLATGEASVDSVTRDRKNAADKTNALPAVSFSYDGSELSRLPLVQVLKVLHLLVCYYICWIIRNLHNCLEFSYKSTNFSADLEI